MARICGGLKPATVPTSVQMQVEAIPPRGFTESEADWLARLTPDQRALIDAFNKEAQDGLTWLTICKARSAAHG